MDSTEHEIDLFEFAELAQAAPPVPVAPAVPAVSVPKFNRIAMEHNGSSAARDQVGLLMQSAFTGEDGGNLDALIDELFANAVKECKR